MRADIYQRAGAMQQAMEIFLIHDEFFPFGPWLRLSFPKRDPGLRHANASLSAYLYLSPLRLQCANAG
jgi:hypothetical protein